MELKALFFAVPGQNTAEIERETRKFLEGIKKAGGPQLIPVEDDRIDYPEPSLVLVQSGGTENIIKEALLDLDPPYFLLAGEHFNALSAALEVLTFLRSRGLKAEVLHGSTPSLARRLERIAKASQAIQELSGWRLGIVGAPSDWLIGSNMEKERIYSAWGIEMVDVDLEELEKYIEEGDIPETKINLEGFSREDREGALRIYAGLRGLIEKYRLQGLTLRCFDLLSSRNNTGCLGLSILNDQGLVGGCEGDVPALISMAILRVLTGQPSFMANPARVDPENNEVVLAHCTVPLALTTDYSVHTHFESGLGIALRGHLPAGPVTIFKLGADGREFFVTQGEIIKSLEEPGLCRTQGRVKMEKSPSYFLENPLGNHHLLVPGHYEELIREFTLLGAAGIREVKGRQE